MIHLEITEAVNVPCDIINKDYQQDARFMHTFLLQKPFCHLLDISRKKSIF